MYNGNIKYSGGQQQMCQATEKVVSTVEYGHWEKISEHLLIEFGGMQECNCGLRYCPYAPPNNSLIEVTEPLEYAVHLYGIPNIRVLQPGIYLVGEFNRFPTQGDHPLHLLSVETMELARINVGDMNRWMIDWRKVKRAD